MTPAGPDHRPQLDALRAIAVLAVVASHAWPQWWSWAGPAGVRLFFVLSGFLITRLLLDSRAALGSRSGATARWKAVGRFAARRALRIFPAYYALVFALALASPSVRHDLAYFLAYVSNWLFAARNAWEPAPLAHAWSLAIEEQFYLAWPLLMLFLPRRALVPLVVTLVAAAPLFRLAAAAGAADPPLATWVLPPAVFDSLGLGALLALVHAPAWLHRVGWAAFALCAIGALLPALQDDGTWTGAHVALLPVLWSIAMCAWVASAARGTGGAVGALLSHPALRYVGRISYGVYLYHLPLTLLLKRGSPRFGLPSFDEGPLLLALATALTVAIAAVSWHAFELPLNRLKRHFADRPRGGTPALVDGWATRP